MAGIPDFTDLFTEVGSGAEALTAAEGAVDKKQEAIDKLEKERVSLSETSAEKEAAYSASIDKLKKVVDAEHARLNPPPPE